MSGERILRSKGSASQPKRIVTTCVVVHRRDLDDVLGKSVDKVSEL